MNESFQAGDPPVPPRSSNYSDRDIRAYDDQPHSSTHDKVLFWGCFIALVTTAFGFIARMFLINTWALEFNLDPAQSGRLAGIGIWPFAVSIIGFSLIIDKIGYKVSMVIAFLGHIIWAAMGVSAYFISKGGDKDTAFQLLYWGSLVLALGNGTVEAFINPVVATMFSKEKTKWLNILHAGWPGGLVIAGMVTIFIDFVPWYVKVGMIAVPALVYFLILLPLRFPVQERVSSGVSYKDMLAEFGFLGSAIVGFLIFLQLTDFFTNGSTRPLVDWQLYTFVGIGAAIVLIFTGYTMSLGRILMFFLVFIMMPLAITEIGTDGWITGIMEDVAKGSFHPGWILVYTSAIMMVLRFFAGPIVHTFSPLGLLAISAALAVIGLFTLSFAAGIMIFVAATLYGFGKTFFWPTMLGVVAEQTPKGGALTLNAISGIGMLTVGTLGFPFIGALQAYKENQAVLASSISKEVPGLISGDKLTVLQEKSIYQIIEYKTIDDAKVTKLVDSLPDETWFKLRAIEVTLKDGKKVKGVKETETDQTMTLLDQKGAKVNLAKADITKVDPSPLGELSEVRGKSKQGALADMAVFPVVMLVAYLILLGYFKAKGGYKPVVLGEDGH